MKPKRLLAILRAMAYSNPVPVPWRFAATQTAFRAAIITTLACAIGFMALPGQGWKAALFLGGIMAGLLAAALSGLSRLGHHTDQKTAPDSEDAPTQEDPFQYTPAGFIHPKHGPIAWSAIQRVTVQCATEPSDPLLLDELLIRVHLGPHRKWLWSEWDPGARRWMEMFTHAHPNAVQNWSSAGTLHAHFLGEVIIYERGIDHSQDFPSLLIPP